MSNGGGKVRDGGSAGPGTVITTFYSFKGGVGRSMALYAVASRLAARRRRVLMVDADLEAPGLTTGALSKDEAHRGRGLAEIASEIVHDLTKAAEAKKPLPDGYLDQQAASVSEALRLLPTPPQEASELLERIRKELPSYPPFRDTGLLALLPVGRVYEDYAALIERIPLQRVFGHPVRDAKGLEPLEGLEPLFRSAGIPAGAKPFTLGDLLNTIVRYALKHARRADEAGAEAPFDYVLVDSRTGLADVAAFCVRGLADRLVVLSGLNKQNLAGLRWLLKQLKPLDDKRRDPEHLVLVLSPVPEAEVELLDKRLADFRALLREFDIEQPITRLHYHPRVALSEEPFTEKVLRHSVLARDYDELAERVQALNHDRPDQWLNRSLEASARPPGEGQTADERQAMIMSGLVEAALAIPETVEQVCSAIAAGTRAEQGRDAASLDILRLLVALDPKDHRYLGALANGLGAAARREWEAAGAERGRALFSEAFAKYAQAVRLKPDKHEAWNNWGNALGALARLEWDASGAERGRALFSEAFAKYAEAVRHKPDLHEAWNNWGGHLGALARLEWDATGAERGRALFAEAFAKYAEAVRHKPDMHEAWNNWGNALGALARLEWDATGAERGRALFSEAFAKYAEAVRIAPGDAVYWANTALHHTVAASLVGASDEGEAAAHASEAARCWEEAQRLDANVARYWRAAAAEVTGQRDEALRLLAEAVRADPAAAGAARQELYFRSLRRDPRYAQIVSRSQANSS